jgi:hypothetical protein
LLLFLCIFTVYGKNAILLPDSIVAGHLFNAQSPQEVYVPKTLFEYINGGAEVYIDAGFAACYARRYGNEKSKLSLEINVYEMGSVLQAFGLFRQLKGDGSIKKQAGAESVLHDRRFLFWKGRFYAEVLDKSSKPVGTAILNDAGRSVDELLPGKPLLPAELQWLPDSMRVPGSERYYTSDFLARSFMKNVVAADYREGREQYTLFIMQAESDSSAKAIMGKLKSVYPAGKPLSSKSRLAGRLSIVDKKFLAIVNGSRIIGVHGGGEAQTRERAVQKCIRRIEDAK